jgi:hypothetical protein
VNRLLLGAFGVGLVGLVISVIGYMSDAGRFFRSYLAIYLFLVSIPLGCLALALLQFLTGGAWGLLLRRILEAGSATLPLLLVMFIPIAMGLKLLYPWAEPAVVASDPLLQQKSPYLNVPFFLLRALSYFIVWSALAVLLARWSREQDRTGDARILPRLQRLAAGGLLLLGLTVTFAAIDWFMSLEPHWYSTAYPPIIAMGAMLSALAFSIVALVLLAPRHALGPLVTPQRLNDLGSLLLAFLMLWTYIAYFQYLLIWSGNLTEEIPWYLRRLEDGWRVVALGIALGGFALPFALLVFRELKRRRGVLLGIAALVLGSRLIDALWMVAPAFPNGAVGWQEFAVLLGLGGLWLALFLNRLAAAPLLPEYDERLGELRHASA